MALGVCVEVDPCVGIRHIDVVLFSLFRVELTFSKCV